MRRAENEVLATPGLRMIRADHNFDRVRHVLVLKLTLEQWLVR